MLYNFHAQVETLSTQQAAQAVELKEAWMKVQEEKALVREVRWYIYIRAFLHTVLYTPCDL